MGKRGKKGALSEEQKNEIRVLYKSGQFSNEKLANMYGVWTTTVARLTKDIDLPRKHKKTVTYKDHMKMVKLYNKGMSYKEISLVLGFSYGCVRRHILKELDL